MLPFRAVASAAARHRWMLLILPYARTHPETDMKLYYSPGACSMADHIALHEAGVEFEHERVDLKTKRTERGDDYTQVNAKGYVPALVLDSGETLTENVAILDWISDQSDGLKPGGPLGRARQLEALAYISGELHKSFGPMFNGGTDEEKAKAKSEVERKLAFLAGSMKGDYLLGGEPGVADFFLFVMLTWATKMRFDIPAALVAVRDRLMTRASVAKAMAHEGLD